MNCFTVQERKQCFLSASFLVILCLFFLFPVPGRAEKAGPDVSGFADVKAMAENLAEQPHKPPERQAPEFLLNLTYEQWRDISFNPGSSLWRSRNLPFEIQFFHPGAHYRHPVDVYMIEGQKTKEIPFSPELFDYGENQFDQEIPEDLGFAGFRVHYNLNQPDHKDEFAVFLGANYFRAIGKSMRYGLSGRGLAIDTGLDSGEEFPIFTKFWIVEPESGAGQLVVYALLQSESYTGAYEFTLRPGTVTQTRVKSRIYQRKPVEKLGIAPLTSMFYYGENTEKPSQGDFRPEVHDSDGLLIAQSTGEWIWHPLRNPQKLSILEFKAPNPIGFGLLQRDLEFDHYQDLEALYNKRPSAWIKPTGGDWGNGRIELIMIPSDKEFNDNIVAFWVPDKADQTKALSFSYIISWFLPSRSPHGGGVVNATFASADDEEKTLSFRVDFKGGKLDSLNSQSFPGARVTVDEAVSIAEQQVQKNPYINGWRMVVKIRAKDKSTLEKVLGNESEPIRLRGFLHLGEDVLTETWRYSFYP